MRAEGMDNTAVLSLIGRRLRSLRKTNELSQREVAERIGLPQSNLSRIENGKQRLNLTVLARMLTLYETSIQDFFAQQDDPLASTEALSARERQLVESYRRLPSEERRDIDAYVDFKLFRARRQRLGHEPEFR